MPFDDATAEPYDPESGEPAEAWQFFRTPPADPELDPAAIAARFVETEEAFAHLKDNEAQIVFLMRCVPRIKQGKRWLGEMIAPRTTGPTLQVIAVWALARLCDGLPDYVMVLDEEFWTRATPHQRAALVWHELEHACLATDKHGETRFDPISGRPIFDIREHDITEFNSVVERFGAWLPDVQEFADALRRGGVV